MQQHRDRNIDWVDVIIGKEHRVFFEKLVFAELAHDRDVAMEEAETVVDVAEGVMEEVVAERVTPRKLEDAFEADRREVVARAEQEGAIVISDSE